MFYHLNGIVSDIDLNLAVIDCNGVGYAVNTTTNTLSRLKLNDRAKLYISECIKEDSFDLYGFATLSEKRCFEMLLGVSGIGPKAAQAILCATTPEGLALAIMNGDDKAITAAKLILIYCILYIRFFSAAFTICSVSIAPMSIHLSAAFISAVP